MRIRVSSECTADLNAFVTTNADSHAGFFQANMIAFGRQTVFAATGACYRTDSDCLVVREESLRR